MKRKKILIIAGEASGDLHAAHLVKSLKSLDPHIDIFGAGGKQMKEAGVEIIYDMVELAVVGFIEVLKHFRAFRHVLEKLLVLLETRKPDVVILVDYPGFNLRFAKYVKEKNIPIVYYISPQIWAWGQNRIADIKKLVDKMVVIFGFEEELYKQAGVKVSFVGHPFLDIVHSEWKKEETIKHLHMKHHSIKIALLPGSRQKEVERHLPGMLKACEIIRAKFPEADFILSRRKELGNGTYNKIIAASKIKPHSLENKPYEIMEVSDLVIVSSGSATLETAIMEKPMVIIYKTSLLTWFLARNLIKIPDIGLVNVVAGKRIVPELIQFEANAKNIAAMSLDILNDKKKQQAIKNNLRTLKARLGEKGAANRAAHLIIQKFL
ncbi:MAG TPA: lipid-A-disaccharide synthase [Candidatus Omnitrophica bacterium]|nr:lipid-A-disaccharide synthase [Candidatus Omnitrophota bacterium]